MAQRIGFVGLGLMGRPMASRLLSADYSLTVHNRSRGAVDELVSKGARPASSPKEVASMSDVVITCLPDAPDVEEVVLGDSGLIRGGSDGMVVVDMSTISHEATVRISSRLKEHGMHMLDAPVSGGVLGAQQGSLSIMVGGEEEVFQRCFPILQNLGTSITHMGLNGSGQITKLCNQIIVAVTLQGVCEAFTVASKAGLDVSKLLKALGGGAANSWQLTNLAPRILKGDFSPGFKARHQSKDLRHALALADKLKATIPCTALVQQFYEALEAKGFGDHGTQAVIKILESLSQKS